MVPAPSGATSLRQWFRLLESVASATLIRMQNTLILEGGRLLDPAAGTDVCGDVILADGQVVSALPRNRPETRIDLAGAWVLSGLLDLHAHFREPGGEASETLEQAVKNFSEYNAKLEAVLAAEGKMDLEQMDAIHQLTYTLENALEKIRKDLDGLAETLEQVHVASEHADEETVRTAGAEYLKVSRTLVK